MKDAYGVHHLDPTDKYRDKYSKSIRKTNKLAIKFFGSVIRWFIFFRTVPASWLTALHRGSIDLEGKKQVQTQRKTMISVTNFTRRLAENPHWITEIYVLFFFFNVFQYFLLAFCF